MVDVNKDFSTTACRKQGESVLIVPAHLLECKNYQSSFKQNATTKTDRI
jgi:hypothetical protein